MLTGSLAELPMVFGTHWEYRGNSTEYEWSVATAMQGRCGSSQGINVSLTVSRRSLAVVCSKRLSRALR